MKKSAFLQAFLFIFTAVNNIKKNFIKITFITLNFIKPTNLL